MEIPYPLERPHRFSPALHEKFEIYEWRNATAVMEGDHPSEFTDLKDVLEKFVLTKSAILTAGGGKSPIALGVNGSFSRKGWSERSFDTKIVVDGNVRATPTHKVDYFKNGVAIEMEWNNKDPFYDRDLNNFRLLHDLRVIDVGVIITRCTELQQLFNELGKGASYGASTTHMNKLIPRLEGRGAAGCPVIAIGIRRKAYDENK
jgi:hypothetical protein